MIKQFDRIKAIVKKINPASERTKEAVDKFWRLYSELYDKR